MNPKIASLIRWLVVLLAGCLVARGRLAPEHQDTFVDAGVQLVGGALGLLALYWSIRDKDGFGKLLNAALASPAGTPVQSLLGQEGGGWKDLLLRQAISTVLALVGDKVSRTRFARYLTELRDALNTAFPPGR